MTQTMHSSSNLFAKLIGPMVRTVSSVLVHSSIRSFLYVLNRVLSSPYYSLMSSRIKGEVSSTKVTEVLKHLITVIRDQRIPSNYRNIYIDILMDVALDFKYAQAVNETNFKEIFNYFSREIPVFASKQGASLSTSLPRLMKGLCRALFCDIEDPSLLTNVFKWFHGILDEVTGTNEQYKYLGSICDSCSMLLGYHGMSHYAVFVENIRLPLQRAIQQLPQLQGSHRQSVYRLISKSFDFFHSCR